MPGHDTLKVRKSTNAGIRKYNLPCVFQKRNSPLTLGIHNSDFRRTSMEITMHGMKAKSLKAFLNAKGE